VVLSLFWLDIGGLWLCIFKNNVNMILEPVSLLMLIFL